MALTIAYAEKLKKKNKRPSGFPFRINKLGHIVLNCADIERSIEFYTKVMGFEVSDIYTKEMVPGGMAFFRCGPDHHSIAVVGSMGADKTNPHFELNHLAFEVATLDEVLRARTHLKKCGVAIDFEGRRRAGAQIAVEFYDPDGHRLEIFWGLDQIGSNGMSRPRKEWIWAHSLEEAIQKPVRGQDTSLQDPKLVRKLTAKQLKELKDHSLVTQAKKLGKKLATKKKS